MFLYLCVIRESVIEMVSIKLKNYELQQPLRSYVIEQARYGEGVAVYDSEKTLGLMEVELWISKTGQGLEEETLPQASLIITKNDFSILKKEGLRGKRLFIGSKVKLGRVEYNPYAAASAHDIYPLN